MIHEFDSNELGFTNQILSDYLTGSDKIKPFYNHPASLEGIEKTIIEKQKDSFDRNTLVEVLLEQLSTFEDKGIDLEKSKSNILKLANLQTFTVTTGQQLHLYLGPGYYGNKIYSCIKLSNFINQNLSQYHTVPVFWLASEDHDTDEISEVELFGETFKTSLPDNKVTGRISTQHIKKLTLSLSKRLGEEANNFEFFQICKNAYETYQNLADATTAIIYQLFGKYGIVVINADNKVLKRAFAAIAKNEIENLTTSSLQEEVRSVFDANNWHYQVMPRGNNLFYIDNENIRHSETSSNYENGKNYSPNALLRPLYQELILPNIAYVGGKAEINYWLQLKPIFDFYKVKFPVIWLRESICLTNEKQWNKFLQTEKNALFFSHLTEQEIENDFLKTHYDQSFIKDIEAIGQNLTAIKTKNSNKDWEKIEKDYQLWLASAKIAYRTVKSDLLKHANYQNYHKQYVGIKQLYFDSANMQERIFSILSLTMNYGYFPKTTKFLDQSCQKQGSYWIIVD